MIIKDFFNTLEELDEFILTLGVYQEAHIVNNVLRVFQWDYITGKDEFIGNKRLIKNISLPQGQTITVTEHKKHYRRH